ncbi:putative methyltransferase Cher3 [Geobacter sp. OR-1]|uniref:CheR family methyltransferase n=1 Tax=Geobacter sp. OR-1 TaxID=1266765 RepID=UPI000543FC9F|nr:protein-glutamate O-methyltransferase CheR [Geobacter sp. OR-1]GAM09425.1 putative methyltransferase Cher3 [Geobacter sp. OR-1]
MNRNDLDHIEMHLLLEGIYRVYGYDFRDYAEASLRRRLSHWLAEAGFSSFSEAQFRVLRDRNLLDYLIRGITVNVSEMFRDPLFFKSLREEVVPVLKTYPFVKIWHAGCATGEEAYSMAIMLNEEGMAGRYLIYATDINAATLCRAQTGIFPLAEMQRYTKNYLKSGGTSSFADYYTARYDGALLAPALRENIVFSTHNLATDADFSEMHLVLCRNVLIYFKLNLKDRALNLFNCCLIPGGFLCLGSKETLENREIAGHFTETIPQSRIYRKSVAMRR